MRWIVSLSIVLAACGGTPIPTHNGYKPKEAKPWMKAKVLKLDDKLEAKTDGSVSYPDMRRARWYEITLPSNGQLTVSVEITPPGDAVNDDFDLGMEVLDPTSHVISKSDLEDGDAHELTKKKTLVDLLPGKYLIHLYLQSRMDTADFVLHASFKTTAAAEAKSDFPAQVPFVPALALVPLQDDTPRNYKPPTPNKPVQVSHVGHRPPPPPPPAPVATVTARIIGIQVVSGGTQLTLGRGTASGASNGMKGKINGVAGGFEIGNCNERTCSATVSATPDQIKNSNGTVTLSGP
ncbi:MAG TPA: hypothetical protein VH165_26915 [Kofleriaceae bacterium]|jgi:hypothetical protein|nr:hypothetical protein [Kofleriaceae bacterium]